MTKKCRPYNICNLIAIWKENGFILSLYINWFIFTLSLYIYIERESERDRQTDRLRSPHAIAANMMDSDIVVSRFKLQSHYYIPFWTNTLGKGINSLIYSSYWLNSTTTVLLQIWFYMKIDQSLSQETLTKTK